MIHVNYDDPFYGTLINYQWNSLLLLLYSLIVIIAIFKTVVIEAKRCKKACLGMATAHIYTENFGCAIDP